MALTVLIVAAAGICGGGVLAPFAATRSRVVLAAPFAGILIVPLVANALYTLVGISFASAAQLSVAACLCMTLVMFGLFRPAISIGDIALRAYSRRIG